MAKFFRRGKSKIYFLTAVAAPQTGVTTAELTAGTDLSASLADVSGFTLTNSPISVPDLSTVFTSQIDGEDTTADSTITFNDDDSVVTIRTALAKGTVGYMILLPYGTAATKRCEVWPVKTTGINDQWSVGNDPARYISYFAITGVPKQNGVVS